jgi:hypothetical protein
MQEVTTLTEWAASNAAKLTGMAQQNEIIMISKYYYNKNIATLAFYFLISTVKKYKHGN